MISTGELKKGVAIELDGELWQILDYHHIKMGRGSAQVRITLRNIKRGQTVERSFQAGTRWPRASMEKRPVQFLYRDGDDHHFMDTDTYDQFILTAEQLGETAQYLKDGMTLDRTSYQGETIGVELPVTVDLRVAETEPGLRGRHADRRPQDRDDRDGPRRRSCRSSSRPATRSASTRGPGSTRPGSDRRRPRWATAAASKLCSTSWTRRSAAAGSRRRDESQALLPNLATVPAASWTALPTGRRPLDRRRSPSTSGRARSCTTTTRSGRARSGSGPRTVEPCARRRGRAAMRSSPGSRRPIGGSSATWPR